MKTTLLLPLWGLLFCCTPLLAQKPDAGVPFTGCATDLLRRQHPELQPAQTRNDQAAYRALTGERPDAQRFAQAVRTLPVVVHIVHNGGPENIPDAQVQQAIGQLNAAFNATFGTGVNTELQFCLAQRDPQGQATSGITRNQSALTSMDLETQDLLLKDLNRWTPTCYINIWVVAAINSASSGNGVVGYAYLPSAHGLNVDGLVVEANYFGSSQSNTGVLVHEMGHYLGLYHTFEGGCGNDDCLLDGDHVCDTPPDQTTFSSCNPNANSCGTDANDASANNPFTTDVPDLGEDYMDYSSLSCFSKFTLGQSDRMNWHLTHVRSSLLACLSCQTPCPAPLAASITLPATNQTITVGSTLNFSAAATNAAAYAWNVGSDPAFATTLNASHLFPTVGVFWVKFTAVSGDPTLCVNVVDSVQVKVVCNAQAVFSVPPVIQNGMTVTFANSSTNATAYEWFVDNISVSTAANLTYTFVNTGAYQLCLRAGNAVCSSTLCTTVYVQANGEPPVGCDNTFIQALASMGGSRPNIFPHPNGDFFATGLRNDSTVIVRFDQGGAVLWTWTYRFNEPGVQIKDLFVDVSGDLIGVTNPVIFFSADARSTAFRYNPTSNTFAWIKDFPSVLYSQIHPVDVDKCVLTGTSNQSRSQLTLIDKNTGAISGYNLQGELGDFYSIVRNNTLYGACRRYYNSGNDFRVAVFAHDLNTGAFEWQNSIISEGPEDQAPATRMYPEKPAVDADNLLILASGDLQGFDTYLTGPVEMAVAKTTLTGDVLWTKQYVISGYDRPVATAIVPTATGYYLVGSLYTTQVGFAFGAIIKIDKQGQVEWAKRLGISGTNKVQNVMERNGYLYLTMSSDSYAPNDLLVIKLDQQGNTGTSCDFVKPVAVNVVDMADIQAERDYDVVEEGGQPIDAGTPPGVIIPQATTIYCNTPCICPDMPISAGADTTICSGETVGLQATAGFDQYVWSPAAGLNNPNLPNPVATPPATTTYTVDASKEGVELVVNSGFGQGNTAFTTQYVFGTQGYGHYWVTDNPTLYNNQWSIPVDHSPSADNMMLLFDGDVNGAFPILWQQSVAVEPNTDYTLRFWAALAYFAGPPTIEIQVNGVVQGSFTLLQGNNQVGIWQAFSLPIQSGGANQLLITLRDKSTQALGNDFALDDISLRNICHYTDSVTISVNTGNVQNLDLGPDVAACVNAVHTFDAGAGFAAYLWQDGSTDRTFTAYTAGTYWVTVRDSCGGIQQDTVQVLLSPSPTLELGADRTICAGDSTQLSYVSNGVFTTYNWTPATGLSCSLCASPWAAPSTTTVYYCAASTVDGCTDLDSVKVIVKPTPGTTQDVIRCENQPFTYNGKVYTVSGTYLDTLVTTSGCDSVVTTHLEFLPLLTRAETVSFCAGRSVTIGGQTYTQSGTVVDTLTGVAGCDTIVTYTLVEQPSLLRADTISFCAGESVLVGGQVYSQPGTVIDTIAGTVGCDTIFTYTLVEQPRPVRADTLTFCPGDSVLIGGQAYSQPGTVIDTIAGTVGCDTIVTYTLRYQIPAPSVVTIQCPETVNIGVAAGAGPTVVTYDLPTAESDCPCPGIALSLTAGLASGSAFLPGNTEVCYTARDSCGHSASCCFDVFIREEQACDIKQIGCMKYELLTITADAGQNYTYRIRATNYCPNELIYTAIQVPDGVLAIEPADLSIFEAESGREYAVRNPNFTPSYSIRFKSVATGIANGQADIFEYTLPAQTAPDYIHITSRLSIQEFYEAHLNTFNCPIGITPEENRPADRQSRTGSRQPSLRIFPNPASGNVNVRLELDEAARVRFAVYDLPGRLQMVGFDETLAAGIHQQQLDVQHLPAGMYVVEIQAGTTRMVRKLVIER